jgi:hypothetical protein
MDARECAKVAVAVVLACAGVAVPETSLTVYNQNFAVVRQPLVLDLAAGVSTAQVTDITARLEPDSVILRDPQGKRVIQILEQSYRADPISQGLLLSLYEGKEIEFLVARGEGKEQIVRGKIIRSGYRPSRAGPEDFRNPYYEYLRRQAGYVSEEANQPVIEVEGKLRFSLPGLPLFPSLGDDTILKPTLYWVLETDQAGRLEAEISYVTGGMSWEADYSMVAPAEGEVIDVIGWVTMDNQSGKTFENTRIKLMAGDVSKVQEVVMGLTGAVPSAPAGRALPAVSEKAFEEYHLYTLARPTTLRDRETKQVEFLRAEGVQAQRLYVYDGARLDPSRYRGRLPENLRNERDYGTQSNPKVWVMREFKNSRENHLGVPLPKGRTRFYRRGDDGQLEFIGENVIDHTPRDETVRVYIGDAFDLVGERRQMDYQVDTVRKSLDETFEIKLRNRKEAGTVEIRVVEHLYRWSSWEVVEKSDPFTKTESQTIEFRVPVPAGEEKIVRYKVHYTW